MIFLFTCSYCFLQSTFTNGSFEDTPADATVPMGWMPCAPGTTPDILPGFWGVYNEAQDGDTFVGLITRQDGSFESITQRMRQTLKKGTCFTLSMYLAHSKIYAGYKEPIKLRIWGGRKKCKKEQLLYETPVIDHVMWKKYDIEFEARKNVDYIILEAFISEEPKSHKGNILIDHLSIIKPCYKA